MEKKVENRELTQDSLKNEAEGKIGKMKENPMFKNMMNGLDQSMNNSSNSWFGYYSHQQTLAYFPTRIAGNCCVVYSFEQHIW